VDPVLLFPAAPFCGIVFPPFHLIFSGLAPCFCFLKLFQAVKFLNEICFFSANSTVYLLILQGFYV